MIESNGLFHILDHHDPTRQIGWNVEAYEDKRGLLDLNVITARERHSLLKMAQTSVVLPDFLLAFELLKTR